MCEGGHQVLTVKSIHDATVAGDGVGEVLQERREQGVITPELTYLLRLTNTSCVCGCQYDLA